MGVLKRCVLRTHPSHSSRQPWGFALSARRFTFGLPSRTILSHLPPIYHFLYLLSKFFSPSTHSVGLP